MSGYVYNLQEIDPSLGKEISNILQTITVTTRHLKASNSSIQVNTNHFVSSGANISFDRAQDGSDSVKGMDANSSSSRHVYAITFAISPAEDLYSNIITNILFEIYVPADYHTTFQGLQLYVQRASVSTCPSLVHILAPYMNDDAYDAYSHQDDGILINIPWLSVTFGQYSLPLMVSFYAIRDLLTNKAGIPPWLAPRQISHNLIQTYIDSDIGDSSSPSNAPMHLVCGSGRSRGKRQYMEDRECIFPTIKISNDKHISIFGVFDGHGGADCSQSVVDELPSKITQEFRNINPIIDNKYSPHIYAEAIYKSFLLTDSWFLKSDRSNSGSTATFLVHDRNCDVIYIANTADSRAVLCRNGQAVDLTKDRKASDPEEIARIYKHGGSIINNRVLGTLAVTRAFGDKEIKSMKANSFAENGSRNESPYNNVLIVDPEVTICNIAPSIDEFIIIACDGLWDVMSSQEAVTMVQSLIKNLGLETIQNPSTLSTSLSKISDQVVQHAINIGSLDNVTVMILYIHRHESVPAPSPRYQRVGCIYHLYSSKAIIQGYQKHHAIQNSEASEQPFSKEVLASKSAIESSCDRSDLSRQNAANTKKTEVLDDLMDFLLDDSNF